MLLFDILPLAKVLADVGHEVVIATGSDLRPRAEVAGFTAFDAGIAPGVAFELLAERYPNQEYNRLEPAELLDWYLPHLFGEIFTPAMLSDLEPLVRSWRTDAILHEIWEFAGPIAAASAGIPSIPQGADQYVIGDLVLAAGVGLLLAPPDVNPSTIRANVLAILDEPVYRDGARRLQREIAAMPCPAEVVHLIEEVATASSS